METTETPDIIPVDSAYYIHDLDKAALQALRSIPGFERLVRSFMKVYSERLLRIINMSSNVRINERQLSDVYDMLPPICARLGIEVPEIYLELDVNPNAYTYGDTKPIIVLTSGLLETIPRELVPTVLAHECGHTRPQWPCDSRLRPSSSGDETEVARRWPTNRSSRRRCH